MLFNRKAKYNLLFVSALCSTLVFSQMALSNDECKFGGLSAEDCSKICIMSILWAPLEILFC